MNSLLKFIIILLSTGYIFFCLILTTWAFYSLLKCQIDFWKFKIKSKNHIKNNILYKNNDIEYILNQEKDYFKKEQISEEMKKNFNKNS